MVTEYNPRLNRWFRGFLRMVFTYYSRVEIRHRDRVSNESVIFCANHCSHIDGAVLYHVFNQPDRQLALIAAADYFFQQNYHALAQKLLPLMPIERHASFESVSEFLASARQFCHHENNSLILFPEGTRSYQDELTVFKPGAAILSYVLNIPMVPIYLHGALNALPKGCFLPRPQRISICIGEPIRPTHQLSFATLHQQPEISQQLILTVRDRIAALAHEEYGLTLSLRE